MNREIEFRAKSKKTEEWVYGDLLHQMYRLTTPAVDMIRVRDKDGSNMYEIISETIGQYTGFTDKNGKKIFEGDILINTTTGIKCIVKFYDTRFMLSYKDREEDIEMHAFLHRMNNLFEVIETIFDEV